MRYIETGRVTAAALLQIILTPCFCLLHFSIAASTAILRDWRISGLLDGFWFVLWGHQSSACNDSSVGSSLIYFFAFLVFPLLTRPICQPNNCWGGHKKCDAFLILFRLFLIYLWWAGCLWEETDVGCAVCPFGLIIQSDDRSFKSSSSTLHAEKERTTPANGWGPNHPPQLTLRCIILCVDSLFFWGVFYFGRLDLIKNAIEPEKRKEKFFFFHTFCCCVFPLHVGHDLADGQEQFFSQLFDGIGFDATDSVLSS